LHAAGKFAVFAEIGAQYRGLSLDDPKLEPFFALAEELDIPVGVHLGEGPPGGIHVGGNPHYRVSLGHPLQLEPVLVKHPKLRLYVMHRGSPFLSAAQKRDIFYENAARFLRISAEDRARHLRGVP
jgi:predicted TIM-barrel fold metal-dependent hydrolase